MLRINRPFVVKYWRSFSSFNVNPFKALRSVYSVQIIVLVIRLNVEKNKKTDYNSTSHNLDWKNNKANYASC